MWKKYKFTIIMAIYNVEKYIDESIQSVVNQSIGFKENIQLILVNDGSTDSSGTLAKAWSKKYKNIKYLSKVNGGPSSARNLGIKFAKGEFVNFLDPDDTLNEDTLELVYKFHNEHTDIKLIKIPIIFFEGRQGDHKLNKYLNEEGIININQQPKHIFLSVASSFFHKSIIPRDGKTFSDKLSMAEDSYFINQIIPRINSFGVVPKAVYNYRFRNSNNSTNQQALLSKDKYMPHLEEYINKYIVEVNGSVHPWVQNVYLYELSSVLKLDYRPAPIADNVDYSAYLDKIREILQHIDDEVITHHDWLGVYQKHALLNLKYKGKIPDNNDFYPIKLKKNDAVTVGFNDKYVSRLSRSSFNIIDIKQINNSLKLTGNFTGLFSYNELNIDVVDQNDEPIDSQDVIFEDKTQYFIGTEIQKPQGKAIAISLDKLPTAIKIRATIKNIQVYLKIRFIKGEMETTHLRKYDYVTNDNIRIDYDKHERQLNVTNKITTNPTVYTYRQSSDKLNFGDEISKKIAEYITGKNFAIGDVQDSKLVAAGSVLSLFQETSDKKFVWGTGISKEDLYFNNPNLIVSAVRGPLTAERIGFSGTLGDPGLLAGMVFPTFKGKRDKIGIIPHYVDKNLDIIKQIQKDDRFVIIDVERTPEEVIYDISKVSLVLSSSLHGLIISDSLEIPNYWVKLSNNLWGDEFKFKDYLLSVNRNIDFVKRDLLNWESMDFDKLQHEYEPVENLMKMQQELISAFPIDLM